MHAIPLVSVALCTYNGEKFLREQLDSLLNQTYRNLEIIVVDDVSSDKTLAILKEYADRDHRIQLFANPENLGYNLNFQKALKLCKGEYIAICDQDDVWHPDKIQTQVALIQDSALIYHDSEFIDAHGKPMSYRISDKFNFYRGSAPEVFLYLNCVSGHSILMKQSLLGDALPFPQNFHYDQWLAFIAAAKGKIDFVDQCLVNYRQHSQNATDLLATKVRNSSKAEKIKKLWQETEWIKLCAEKLPPDRSGMLRNLYSLSLQRNRSFFSLGYMAAIFHDQETLLFLLKKSRLSKFFYILRKAWGQSSKQLS